MVLFNNRTQMRSMKGGIHSSGGRVWYTSSRSDPDPETGHGRGVSAATPAMPHEFALKSLPTDVINVDGYDLDLAKISTHG